jgi:peroxiredoxin Q/BCP
MEIVGVRLQPGQEAPAFSLKDDEGKVASTKDLRGSRYVVYFYPKDDTPGCTTEACQFTDNFPQFEMLGVPVLGVSQDDAAAHQAFRKKYNLRVRLLSDVDRKAHQAYGAWGERPGRGEGVIRSTFLIGSDGRVEKSWYFVKPDGHALEVLSALRA